ncbi:MAG: hypothetical protein GY937_12580 [bacterium]|nr:hypothetical protein [bacterium]
MCNEFLSENENELIELSRHCENITDFFCIAWGLIETVSLERVIALFVYAGVVAIRMAREGNDRSSLVGGWLGSVLDIELNAWVCERGGWRNILLPSALFMTFDV